MKSNTCVGFLGATGFTGRRACIFFARKLQASKKPIQWIIAGRDQTKLNDLYKELEGCVDDSKYLPTIAIVDINVPKTLKSLAKSCSILANCVGPYRHSGEAVVKSCVEEGCHYLDISGEPEFIEKMQLKYNEEAKRKGVAVVSAVGFDSIPADIGCEFVRDLMAQKEGEKGQCTAIESFLSLKSKSSAAGHFPTWESAVYGFHNQANLSKIRKELKLPKLNIVGKKLKVKGIFWHKELKKWCLPFPGADASIVKRSQIFRQEELHAADPIQYCAYFTISSTFYLIIFLIFGALFALLAKFEWGMKLLLNYPEIFSFGLFKKSGPTEQEMKDTSFEMAFFAKGIVKGSNDNGSGNSEGKEIKLKAVVKGPEPGYVATPIFLVDSILALVNGKFNESLVKDKIGGVYTTASLFDSQNLIGSLRSDGIVFSELK